MHPGDEIAERHQPSLRLAKRGVEMLPSPLGVGGELSLGELKIDHRGDELLLCPVVEITGEPLTSPSASARIRRAACRPASSPPAT